MRWSPQQERALDDVGRFLKDPHRQTYYLAGFAGTGKTTLARHLAETVDGLVLYAAYTGKAAYVLRSKGCEGASTIHKLIYKPKFRGGRQDVVERQRALDEMTADLARMHPDDPQFELTARRAKVLKEELRREIESGKRPLFALNPESEATRAKLLVIDECSMVGGQMGRDVESFGPKVLVLGDPAQLPPVGDGGYWTGRKPDFLLTEIHRQAAESGILQLATSVRQGRAPTPGMYGTDCRVLSRSRLDGEELQRASMAADMLLVGRNATRHGTNAKKRRLLGFTDPNPTAGDTVICLRNDADEPDLLNGSIWRVEKADAFPEQMRVSMDLTSAERAASPLGTAPVPVLSYLHHFYGQEERLRVEKMRDGFNRSSPQEFDFAQAITVHKSQGSQWDTVVLFDESSIARSDAHRWLYTGITRAAKALTVVVS